MTVWHDVTCLAAGHVPGERCERCGRAHDDVAGALRRAHEVLDCRWDVWTTRHVLVGVGVVGLLTTVVAAMRPGGLAGSSLVTIWLLAVLAGVNVMLVAANATRTPANRHAEEVLDEQMMADQAAAGQLERDARARERVAARRERSRLRAMMRGAR